MEAINKFTDSVLRVSKTTMTASGYINTGAAATEALLYKNVESITSLVVDLAGYLPNNQLLGIFLNYYEGQFNILARAFDIYGGYNSTLENDFLEIVKKLNKAVLVFDDLDKKTAFDQRTLKSGPFFYLASLQKEYPSIPFDVLQRHVTSIISYGTVTTKELDKLTPNYDKLFKGLKALYRECEAKFDVGRNSDDNLRRAFSGLIAHKFEAEFIGLVVQDNIEFRLNSLKRNQHAWKNWLR